MKVCSTSTNTKK